MRPRSCAAGTDLVIAAELLGHARLETTRVYARPTAEDRSKAIDLLPVDEYPGLLSERLTRPPRRVLPVSRVSV